MGGGEIRAERLPNLASDLVRLKVNVIVGATTPLIHAAKNASETIPIVYGGHHRPCGSRGQPCPFRREQLPHRSPEVGR